MKGSRSRGIVVAAVAVCLVLAGCGGPSAQWRHQGKKVVGVEESLATIDAEFAKQLKESDGVPVTIPEEARCFFQVTGEKEVLDEAFCGPIKYLGSDTNIWGSTPLEVRVADKQNEVMLVAGEDLYFEQADPDSSAKLLDAKGDEGDPKLKVAAPPAPRAEVGDTLSVADAESTLDEPLEVGTPDATYSFSALGVTDHVGEGADRVDAPKDGTLVTVGMDRSSAASAPNGFTSTATLTVGGEPVEIPEQGGTIAVKGDGKDAKVAIEYDGNTQVVSLADKKVVSGHAYVDTDFEPVNAPQKVLIGDEANGASTSYTYQVDASVTSWDPEQHWAPEGKDRLGLVLSFDESSSFKSAGSFSRLRYDDTKYAVTAVNLTVDGQPVAVDAAALAVEPRPDSNYSLKDHVVRVNSEIPAGAKSIKVTATVSRSGGWVTNTFNSYDVESVQGEPASIDQNLDLAEVTLEPQTSGWGG